MWLSCQAPTLVLASPNYYCVLHSSLLCLPSTTGGKPVISYPHVSGDHSRIRYPAGRGSAKRSPKSRCVKREERNLRKAHQFEAIPSPWRRGGKDSNQRRSLGDGASRGGPACPIGLAGPCRLRSNFSLPFEFDPLLSCVRFGGRTGSMLACG